MRRCPVPGRSSSGARGRSSLAWIFKRSAVGLRLIASREDPVAAVASGSGSAASGAIALVVSAFISGVAGGLFALHFANISPLNFYLSITFTLVAMLVVGGAESLSGAVVGVLVVTTLLQAFRQIEDGIDVGPMHLPVAAGLADFGLALGLLAILILRPRGITGGRELRRPHLPRKLPRRLPETASSSEAV